MDDDFACLNEVDLLLGHGDGLFDAFSRDVSACLDNNFLTGCNRGFNDLGRFHGSAFRRLRDTGALLGGHHNLHGYPEMGSYRAFVY